MEALRTIDTGQASVTIDFDSTNLYVLIPFQIFLPVFIIYTGDSRYVDLVYLDTITYVEEIFHSQHFFSMYLCISTQYLEVIFHALDIFSIIFATFCVEV